MTEVLTDTQPIRLKGRSFLALTLSPEPPFDLWLQRFDDLVTRSAGFFLQRPVVLDVAGSEIGREDLRGLIDQLGSRDVRILGIEGAPASLLGPDMPPAMTGGLPASDCGAPEGAPEGTVIEADAGDGEAPGEALPSLMVTEPVRSGQALVSEGDITVVGQVASGAEVIAGGSIHIYGTLRGRALAGARGDTRARIFCRKFQAELVAIASLYMTSEDFEPGLHGQAVQLRLENDTIRAENLG